MKSKSLLLLILTGILVAVSPGNIFAQQPEEQLGVQYYMNRELDKAQATFESLYSKNPSQFNYIYYINTLLELKEFDKAERLSKNK